MTNNKTLLVVFIVVFVIALTVGGIWGLAYWVKTHDTQSDIIAADIIDALISENANMAYGMLSENEPRKQFEEEFEFLCQEWKRLGGTSEYTLEQKDWHMYTEIRNGERETSYECLYYVYSGGMTFTLEFSRIESKHSNGVKYCEINVLR